ncbi:MAG: DUF1778 domain-containing protein [Flavobacteriaceae bacterium]
MTNTAQPRSERAKSATINLRVSEDVRNLIDEAASTLGKSRTEFMLDSARAHALDVMLEQRLFRLDAERFDAFAASLDNPPPQNAALKALMAKKPLWGS